jgi:hypothetical protein
MLPYKVLRSWAVLISSLVLSFVPPILARRFHFRDGQTPLATLNCPWRFCVFVVACILSGLASMSAQGLRAISVDASAPTGKIRSLQGVSGLPIPVLPGLPTLTDQFRSLRVDFVRLHDTYGRGEIDSHFCVGGCPNFPIPAIPANYVATANLSVIFPNPAADPEDAGSYNFGPTDEAVRSILRLPARVYFRVGRSQSALSAPPVDDLAHPDSLDFDRYAKVLKHVVMHYVQGWNHGFINAVRYWEIWNEPGLGDVFWNGTAQQYYSFYKRMSQTIKSVDQQLQVGGPTEANNYAAGPYREAFVSYCAANHLPLDFFSWHWYPLFTNDPQEYVSLSAALRKILDSYGFTKTELVLSEWGSSVTVKLSDLPEAAYVATAMIYMQDAPVDIAMFYRGDGTHSGLFQADASYTPSAHAFQAMGMMDRTPVRIRATGGDQNGFAVLAGRSQDGNVVHVLVSNFANQINLLPPAPPLVNDGFGNTYVELPVKVPVTGLTGLLDIGVFDLPPARSITHDNNGGYTLSVEHLGPGRFTLSRYRITENASGASSLALVEAATVTNGTVKLTSTLAPPGIELVVIERGQ